ncbi:hypothetical protein TNCV_1078921 [Trichonephila clavipes]|nr:hypothetical protein TNCV_1078921 [Trichonephila clavipes]
MDVCKYILPSWHGVTLNSRQTVGSLVTLVAGDERWETPAPQGVLPQNWGGTEITFDHNSFANPTPLAHANTLRVVLPRGGTSQIVLSPVWCSRPRPKSVVHVASCYDEFRGPRSDYVRQRVSPIMAEKDSLELVQSSKNTIDADSGTENEVNNAAHNHTSSEVRNTMKSMRSYLDTYSYGEMNIKMEDIEQFVNILMLKRQMQCEVSDYLLPTK